MALSKFYRSENQRSSQSVSITMLLDRWIARFGFWIFSFLSCVALIKLLTQSVPGHYRIFTGAGRALWHGLSPYGTDYGTGVGYYFYSPSCALLIFGPLSFLPEKLGLLIFILVSWLVFIWGVKEFFSQFFSVGLFPCASDDPNEQISGDVPSLGWFWIAISPQIFGGVLASKLEILMVGLLLGFTAWLSSDFLSPRMIAKNRVWKKIAACIAIAATLNWKFQPLPLVGLFMLSWVGIRRDWKVPAVLSGATLGFYLLPFLFFEKEFLTSIHRQWQTTFSFFVEGSYLNFENVFSFLNHLFGLPISYFEMQISSAIVGVGLAIFLVAFISKTQVSKEDRITEVWNGAVLLSVALGSAYMTAFSPLGQNNALVLYAPLLLVGFVLFSRFKLAHDLTLSRRWKWILVTTFFGMTLLYSDAVPKNLRDSVRYFSLKPLFCLHLALWIAVAAWRLQLIPSTFRDQNPNPHSDKSKS